MFYIGSGLEKDGDPSFLFSMQLFSLVDNFKPNSFSGKHQEAEKIISRILEENLDLDTVAYNTFIKSMLEAG